MIGSSLQEVMDDMNVSSIQLIIVSMIALALITIMRLGCKLFFIFTGFDVNPGY